MNKKAVRIGILISGLVSTLLFITFLPVFIWSPPWSENGYYRDNDWSDGTEEIWINFNAGDIIFNSYYHDEDQLGSGWSIAETEHAHLKLNGDHYQSYNTGSNSYMVVIINDNIFTIYHPEENSYRAGRIKENEFNSFVKTSNPLKIWWIKWIEWTAE